MTDAPPPSELPPRGAHRLASLLIIAAVLVLDLGSKALARRLLLGTGRLSYLGDVFRLELVRNAGAFLSLGANLPPGLRSALLTWGVLVLAAGAAWVALFGRASRASAIGAALVAGGGFGNLWDRFTDHGLVTDFMNLGLGTLRTGIFNVADLAIVGGVLLLVFAPHGPGKAQEGEPR